MLTDNKRGEGRYRLTGQKGDISPRQMQCLECARHIPFTDPYPLYTISLALANHSRGTVGGTALVISNKEVELERDRETN